MISVDFITGGIKVNSNKPEGVYTIKVEGMLNDLKTKDYQLFKIIVTS